MSNILDQMTFYGLIGNKPMTDNVAILMGYTVNVSASSGEYDLNLLIRPNTDTGDCFKAWCCDEQEFISVNGWMFDIEQVGE